MTLSPLTPSGPANRPHWFLFALIAVVGLAAALRFVHIQQVNASEKASALLLDELYNDGLARQYRQGDWIGKSATYQDPLYPYLLAGMYRLLGQKPEEVRFVHGVLGALTVLTVGLLGGLLGGPGVGIAAAIFYALLGPALFYEGKLLKTVVQVFVASLLLWLLYRAKLRHGLAGWFLAGAVLGLALMLRGNFRLFIPLVWWWAGWARPPFGEESGRQKRAFWSPDWKPLIAITFGIALVVWPFPLRNYLATGEFVFGANCIGQNLYLGNYSGNTNGGFVPPNFLRTSPEFEESDFRREAERRVGNSMTPKESSEFWTKEAFREIVANPGHFLRLLVKKFRLVWHYYEIPDSTNYYFYKQLVPVLSLPFPGFGLLTPLALMGLVLSLRYWRRFFLLHLCSGLYILTLLFTFILSRHRLTLAPWFCVLAGFAIVEAVKLLQQKKWRGLAPAALVAVAVTLFVNLPRVQGPATIGWYNLGTSFEEQGDDIQARNYYLKAIENDPHYFPALLNLANLAMDRGDLDSAKKWLHKAREFHPKAAEPLVNMASIALKENNTPEAIRFSGQLTQEHPGNPLGWFLLGQATLRLGYGDRAVDYLRRALYLQEDLPEVAMYLASAYEMAENWEEAGKWYQEALLKKPEDPAPHYFLGALLIKQGKKEEARKEFELYLQAEPKGTLANAARTRLFQLQEGWK